MTTRSLTRAYDAVLRTTLAPCREYVNDREVPATGLVACLWARHGGQLTAHTILIWKN
jgi:hypothetical protein